MTIDQFRTGVPPTEGSIVFYHTGTPPVIKALNVSNTANLGINVAESLSRLIRIIITVQNTPYVLEVTSISPLPGYYNIRVSDTTLPSDIFTDGNLIDEISVNPTFLVPNLQAVEILKSDYNATLNNAEINRSVSFIYDVDRTKYSGVGSRPVNYEAIITGTATPAQYQELNYTSIGLTNSRYAGSKTTAEQYGTSPAFSGIPTNAAIYSPSQDTGYICSQSLSDRNIEEVIIGYDASSSPSYDGNTLYTEDIRINYNVLAKFVKDSGTIASDATEITLNAYLDIYPEDLIRIKLGTPEEVMKVVSVTSKTSTSTTFTAIRAYRSDINPDNTGVAITGGAIVQVSRLTGTLLFKSDRNKLYTVSNKKVWVEKNTKVFYTDERGEVIFELITCSI